MSTRPIIAAIRGHHRLALTATSTLVWWPLVAAAAEAPSAAPALTEPQRTLAVLDQLDTTIGTCVFDERPFDEVLQWFRGQGLRNILVRWGAVTRDGAIQRSTPVTVELYDVTIGELLDVVLAQASAEAHESAGELTYHVRRGMVEISNRADFSDETVTRVYDFSHAIQPVLGKDSAHGQGYPAPVGTARTRCRSGRCVRAAGGAFDLISARARKAENAINLIKNLAPETWLEAGGPGWIMRHEDFIVVHQTYEVHEMIAGTVGGGHTRD